METPTPAPVHSTLAEALTAAATAANEMAAAGSSGTLPGSLIPRLPSFKDKAALISYAVSAVGLIAAILGMFGLHLTPGFEQQAGTVAGSALFFGAQAVNIITHRGANKAVAVELAKRLGL